MYDLLTYTENMAEENINNSSIILNDRKPNRFSDKEKQLLYDLFAKYQNIIDIKQRKTMFSSQKQSEVRRCWNLIMDSFNEHAETNNRNLKQLQKFWLNSK